MDDVKEYEEMRNAMNVIGISTQEQSDIFNSVAAIMWMGNVDFQEVKTETSGVTNQDTLEYVGSLLQVFFSFLFFSFLFFSFLFFSFLFFSFLFFSFLFFSHCLSSFNPNLCRFLLNFWLQVLPPELWKQRGVWREEQHTTSR